MRRYLQFVREEKRLLSFGLTFNFFSSFGQTFLISLFVPYFLRTFSLSNAGFGIIYSTATLGSAILLPFLGKWIDRLPLKKFSLLVAMALMMAAFTVSVAWHVNILFIGVMLLRLAGKGLSAHTAQTAMTKFVPRQPGKALGVASLGYPLGEAVLPLIIALLIPFLGWRGAWSSISLGIGILLIPFILSILNGRTNQQTTPRPQTKEKSNDGGLYRSIISDKRTYLLLPAVLLPAFWVTALFLYQVNIAGQLGWSAALIATAFVAHALTRIACSLFIGPAIDKFAASKLFPFHLIPMGLSLFVAWLHPGNWAAFLYMMLLGVTLGASGNLKSALWAELYGSEAVGRVQSFFSSVIVFAAAISPFLMGWMIDHHVLMGHILLFAISTVVVASLLAGLAFRGK